MQNSGLRWKVLGRQDPLAQFDLPDRERILPAVLNIHAAALVTSHAQIFVVHIAA
jgi:hypothetical protein